MRVNYVPSTSHWIFPPIIMGILGFLLLIMFFQRVLVCQKEGKVIFDYKNYHFFDKNWDKLKLLGSLILFVCYIKSMNIFGFLISSIIFIFLYNILFIGIKSNKKSIINSLLISLVFSIGIWILFGQIFKITLP